MRLSTLFGRTLREAPADAEHEAYQLILRAGLARPLLAGSYALLPLGMRVLRQIELIMHEELARIGAQELRTPVVQSSVAWQRSGRYALYGPLILHAVDRSERELIVAPTHEEAIAELARREIVSYRQMPAIVYQVHTKYRDEVRVKGGLMRMREFTMLDAYSLDADDAGLDASYQALASAFERIFDRCGVRYTAVAASAGEMGGSEPREYMALSATGEDTLVLCANCGYAANAEVAVSAAIGALQSAAQAQANAPMAEIATPHTATIADLAALLGIAESATAKAVFFDTERGLVFAVIRGDLEVNEAKLRAVAHVTRLDPATAEQIAAAGAVAGYASPVGLTVQAAAAPAGAGVLVVADQSLLAGPLVAGANREGYHLKNVVYGRDWHATVLADIATVREGDPCVQCGAPLHYQRGVEIGHIFKLGTHFSQALDANFLDANGEARPIVMGSYGIGLERLLQLIVEQHHDAAGITWPIAVAPFDIHLIGLGKSDAVRAAAETLYAELRDSGLRVLFDDREESPGIKFNDADLIGLPLRVVMSERLLAAGQIEIKPRQGEANKIVRAQCETALRTALARTMNDER